jgi:uncharacterized protein (TIGR03437 family)
VVTSANAVGTVPVVITNPYGTLTTPTSYTYGPPPAVYGVDPISGSTAGGTTVMITGKNLGCNNPYRFAPTVTFGGTSVTGTITCVSDTQITLRTPAHAAGSVSVVVTTSYGTATSSTNYTYTAP